MIHRKIFFVFLLAAMACLAEAADLVKKPSQKGVQETMDKLEAVVRDKGLTVFNRIDHQANARKAGLEQPAAQVLIFGNPKIGTAIMTQDPAARVEETRGGRPALPNADQGAHGAQWQAYGVKRPPPSRAGRKRTKWGIRDEA